MAMTPKEYDAMSKKASPPSPFIKNFFMAFVIGGLICALGQVFIMIYEAAGIEKELAGTLCSVSLVFLSVLSTGLGVYDVIAKHAGAGTLVPITGFANSMAAAAIEFKSEGWILGLGAKIFTIAGPVIVYGVCSSVLYGIILSIIRLVT